MAATVARARKAQRTEDLMYAVTHPCRVAIMEYLHEQELQMADDVAVRVSPVELVTFLEEGSLGTISYHVRILHDLGLLAKAGTKARRGATQHYYKLTEKARLLLPALATLRETLEGEEAS